MCRQPINQPDNELTNNKSLLKYSYNHGICQRADMTMEQVVIEKWLHFQPWNLPHRDE